MSPKIAKKCISNKNSIKLIQISLIKILNSTGQHKTYTLFDSSKLSFLIFYTESAFSFYKKLLPSCSVFDRQSIRPLFYSGSWYPTKLNKTTKILSKLAHKIKLTHCYLSRLTPIKSFVIIC